MPSVGATENVMMAATLAKGKTVIINAAKEPEIVDLANCLNKMGAKIKGAGTSKIVINGVLNLKGCTHSIIPDRIEAITYIIAAAITGGKVIINGINSDLLGDLHKVFKKTGVNLKKVGENLVEVSRKHEHIKPSNVKTAPFPGFPTDIQAQFMSLMVIANGKSKIKENIFENRYMHVPELQRMGANIKLKRNKAIINGTKELVGAEVMATDLRASVSLVLAGLVAKGTTSVNRVYHLERGYDHLVEKLQKCGIDIEIMY
jgi:UDP-N-acetylglucosamine 1-carboxyvinyltransferase